MLTRHPPPPQGHELGAKSTGLTSLAPPFLSPPHTKQLRYLSLTEEVLGAVVVIVVVLWEVIDPEAVPSVDTWRKQGETQTVTVLRVQTAIHSRHGRFVQVTGAERREVASEVPTA